MSTTSPDDVAPDEGVGAFSYLPAMNNRTGREFTIDEQRDKQELFPAGPLRDIMEKAVQERIRQGEARIASERLLTRDQVIITRSIQEEQNRRRRVQKDAMEKRVMLEFQADPSVNIHGYSAAGVESLAHMAKSMSSMLQPGEANNFLAALKAMDAGEVKAFKRANRANGERGSVLRAKAVCGHCGQHGALHKCGGCHYDSPARYCDRDCQRAAWKGGHKEACPRKKEPFGGSFPKDGYKDLDGPFHSWFPK
jgi:hypothetical protein